MSKVINKCLGFSITLTVVLLVLVFQNLLALIRWQSWSTNLGCVCCVVAVQIKLDV